MWKREKLAEDKQKLHLDLLSRERKAWAMRVGILARALSDPRAVFGGPSTYLQLPLHTPGFTPLPHQNPYSRT
jgi:hypothetical protein